MPTSDELNAYARAVAQGDRQAFAVLFKHFAPRIKSYLVKLGTSEGLAEELAQEAMVNVWRKAPSFDAQRSGVSTWIFTIARNQRIDHFRRHDSRMPSSDEMEIEDMVDGAAEPDDCLLTAQRERGVRLALLQLPVEQAEVLRLSFFEEHAHAQIASELGIPLGTVKSRVRLAVNHMRRLLGAFES